MAEKATELKVFKVSYICDKCGEGEMVVHRNYSYCPENPEYPHTCNKCDYTEKFRKKYPANRYKELK